MKNLILIIFICLAAAATSCLKSAEQDENKTWHLNFDTIRITQGITQYLAATDLSAAEITFKSADTTIATIDDKGVVKGIKPGQTLITATTTKYKTAAKCVVIVTANKVSEMKVSDVGVGADGSIFTIGTDIVSPTGGFGIYQLLSNNFDKLPYCAGTRISVAPNGKPWVVNHSRLIFRFRDAASPWEELPGSANDIAVGANGAVFVIGTTQTSATGGYNILKWNENSYTWTQLPDCAGVRIAVDPTGTPWVINSSNKVFKYDGANLWNQIGSIAATDIGIGKDGSVFVTGTDKKLYKLNNAQTSEWVVQQGKPAVSISVAPNGQPVYIDPAGYLYK